MDSAMKKSSSRFELHLDGESEIDAVLLSRTIMDMAELTKIMTKEYSPDAYIKINVTAFKNGSFQIDFSAVTEVAEMIWGKIPDAVSLAGTVVAGVVGVFELKKLIGGEKPKKVEEIGEEKILVESSDGKELVLPKNSGILLKDAKVDQLTVNIANYAYENNESGGFSLSSQEKTLRFESSDILKMKKSLPLEEYEETTCKRMSIRTKLVIKKPDIMGASAWGFYYNDKIIQAKMSDEEWIERLHKREFSIGYEDMIDAKLEIYVDLDPFGHPVDGTEKYNVSKVFGDIEPRDRGQTKIEEV